MSWIAKKIKVHTEMNGQSDIDSKLDQLLKDLNEVFQMLIGVNKVARTILMQ